MDVKKAQRSHEGTSGRQNRRAKPKDKAGVFRKVERRIEKSGFRNFRTED